MPTRQTAKQAQSERT